MNETSNGLINTITVGTSIKGDIQANGDFRMDGSLEGNITLTGKLVDADEQSLKLSLKGNAGEIDVPLAEVLVAKVDVQI